MWIQPIDCSGQTTFVACVQGEKGKRKKEKEKKKNPQNSLQISKNLV